MSDEAGSLDEGGIAISGLHYRYGKLGTPALDNIHLTIKPARIFGLLGPNGAGKTTLISLLTGVLTAPSDAMISVLGFNLPREGKKIREISSLVPQDYAFYPMLTARENLQHFSGLYGQSANTASTQIEYCVEVCGLQAVLDRRASEYSGGVKRRLNLAIGLLNKPRVLYLDEPTVGIDAQSRHFILDAITALNREGMTIVYTSHYMDEVQTICDDIAVIDHGRVVASDSVAGLLSDANRTQLMIDLDSPLTQQQINSLRGLTGVDIEAQRINVEVTTDTQRLVSLLSMLNNEGVGVAQIHSAANKLEQTYLSLTRQDLRD
jgi:ABC-type multidrug transport system ATPase subunit